MTTQLMKNIDRFLGTPLCWVLGVFYIFLKMNKCQYSIENVLVIKFFGLGSILLSTPALSLIKSSYPQANITFLSFTTNKELLERLSIVDKVLTINTESISKFSLDTLYVLSHLFGKKYDVVFDLEFFSKFSTLISGLTFAPMRVAFALNTFWRSSIVTHQIPLKKDSHVQHAFCKLVSIITKTDKVPSIYPPVIKAEDVQSLSQKIPLNGKPIIMINVNAGETFLERRWNPERFAELVAKLSKQNQDCIFFFTGTTKERDYIQRIIDSTPCGKRCYNLGGLLSIPELGALLQRSELLISNDSGPLHLAAALGTASIGLYGPESPNFYGPIGAQVKTIYKQISCSPCMNIYQAKSFRCPYDAKCMKMIQVNEVKSAVEELYASLSCEVPN